MESNELLQAIRQIVKEEVEPIRQDVSGLKKGQESLIQDVSSLKAGQGSLQEQITKTNITLENEIGKKLSALFDAHQLDSEKIQSVKDTVESIEEVVDANDTLSRVNAREIRRLKEKLG